MVLRSKAGQFVAVLILVIGTWLLTVSTALAAPISSPQTCRVGIYVTSLRNFKFADKSFRTDFRVWSVCPSKDLKPLESMEIIDALESKIISDHTTNKKNQSDSFATKEQVYWSERDLSAVLYQNWGIQNYPFDRHTLKITLEEGIQDATGFVYTPDFKNSGYLHSMKGGGGKLPISRFKKTRLPTRQPLAIQS